MKPCHLFTVLLALFLVPAALDAQTPEEIVKKMTSRLERSKTEGIEMDVNLKLPIVGTVKTHSKVRGDKMRSDIRKDGKYSVIWTDASTKWEYDAQGGVITISPLDDRDGAEQDKSDRSAFDSLDGGYALTLEKETDAAWFILCRKTRGNKSKDDPKKIELCVDKSTGLPIYLKTSKLLISISMENISVGVPESDVTFRPSEFPGATLIDKR